MNELQNVKMPSDWWVTANLRTTPERTEAVNMLVDMHTYKRPAFSKTERAFIARFLKPLGVTKDKFGNCFLRIGSAPILFSSHTDTVHEAKGIQTVGFCKNELGIAAEDKSGSSCLGADDTVGVWHMIQMIKAKVPGLYIFHMCEEKGRKGSIWIKENNKELLAGIKMAIAFDRRAEDSVITHQMGDRCCSAKFSDELATLLSVSGYKYKQDSGGSFTDTATYTDLIGECTNISVGYTAAHSKWERLDLEHAMKLRDVLCSQEFSAGLAAITVERKPGEKEARTYTSYTRYNGHGTHNSWEKEYWEEWALGTGTTSYHKGNVDNFKRLPGQKYTAFYVAGSTWDQDLKMWVLPPEQPNERNPGTEVITLPATDQKGGKNIIITPPSDAVEKEEDDEADFEADLEAMSKLVERNHASVMEVLADLALSNPETVALVLQESGMNSRELADAIIEQCGVCHC